MIYNHNPIKGKLKMFQLVIELDGVNVKTDFIRESEEEVTEIANKIANNEYDTRFGKDYDMHCYEGIIDIGEIRISPVDAKYLSSKTITGVKVLEICEGIKINKKSWHYRFNKFARSETSKIPNNLCGYFWSTLAYLALWVALISGITTVAYLVADSTGLIAAIGTLVSSSLVSIPLGVLGVVLFFVVGVSLIVGLIWIGSELNDKFSDWNYSRKSNNAKLKVQKLKEKSESIAVESMKSFKSKHCPLIEFNEE